MIVLPVMKVNNRTEAKFPGQNASIEEHNKVWAKGLERYTEFLNIDEICGAATQCGRHLVPNLDIEAGCATLIFDGYLIGDIIISIDICNISIDGTYYGANARIGVIATQNPFGNV